MKSLFWSFEKSEDGRERAAAALRPTTTTVAEFSPCAGGLAWPTGRAHWSVNLAMTHGQRIRRLALALPGVLTWLAISALFWGPLVFPWPLAFAIVAFDLYWFARAFSAAYHGIQGYWRIKAAAAVDWRAEYEKALDDGQVLTPWETVHHVVIIPNLNEETEKLRATLQALSAQEHVARQITVVLAMEAKEQAAYQKASMLQEEFRESFGNIVATFHPAGLPGEAPGKSSNEAWAARRAKELLVDERGYDLATMTVTSCDADSLFHPRYFSCLTFRFCTDPQRHRRFWQAPIFLYNNIWRVPMPIRVVSVLSNISFLGDLCKGHRLVFPQSTYSLSFQMAHEVDYWDPEVIPEDWHMFLKCFFHLRGEVDTEPIFLPIGADAVHAATYWQSLVTRYKQAKRHAWGAEDIAYAAREFLLHPEIPWWLRARRMWALVENHLLWSTHWFILTLGGAVPTLLAAPLQEMTPFAGLPQLVSLILTACLGPFVIVIALDWLLRPPPPTDFKRWFVPVTHLQWFLLPVTSAVFATLPALHAQTQMMLGKPLIYEVTKKV
ncbi:MAG: hypothetical protein HYY02_07800 [Chloroflexi bacterium]|nr:hypothetical protein [Chloroflexota bacterium]